MYLKMTKKDLSSAPPKKEHKTKVTVELTASEIAVLRKYCDLKVSATPTLILNEYIKFGLLKRWIKE